VAGARVGSVAVVAMALEGADAAATDPVEPPGAEPLSTPAIPLLSPAWGRRRLVRNLHRSDLSLVYYGSLASDRSGVLQKHEKGRSVEF
jgi:hypothetical protein